MRIFAAAAVSCVLLLAGGVAGFFLGRDTSSVRQDAPTLESARRLVAELCRQQLPHEVSGADFLMLHADHFCTRRLKELLIKEYWRGDGFYEGFDSVNRDPLFMLKPPFANGGWFVTCSREGVLSVSVAAPELHDGIVKVVAHYTCTIGDQTTPHGEDTFVLKVEDGTWRVDDVLWDEGNSLVRELSREKYM